MITQTVPVTVASASRTARGEAQLTSIPREVAVQRGVIAWLGAWLCGVAALPIPIVHFIAPPLLLLLGPVLGFAVFRLFHGATDIAGGNAACPDCGAPLSLGPCAERWPLDVVCAACAARLQVEKAL